MILDTQARLKLDLKASSPSLNKIVDAVRSLNQPSPSLYNAYLRERADARQENISALDRAMDQTRSEAFAAAVRLMSLDAEERTVFSAYTDLLG